MAEQIFKKIIIEIYLIILSRGHLHHHHIQEKNRDLDQIRKIKAIIHDQFIKNIL